MSVPKRLVIPPSALAEWREKYPCLPAFEPVHVGDPGEVYVHESVILSDPRVKALVEALRECEAEIDSYIRQEYSLDHPLHERNRQNGFESNPARIALAAIKEATHAEDQ